MPNIKVECISNSIRMLLSDQNVCSDKAVLLKLKLNLTQSIKQNKNGASKAVYVELMSKIDNLLLEIKYIETSTEKKSNDHACESVTLRKEELNISTPNGNKTNLLLINTTETDKSVSTSSASRLHLLLKSQKDLTTQELEQENRSQNEVSSELSQLTSILKEVTIQMNESVRQQNIDLESIRYHAVDNASELDEQRKKMNAQEKRTSESMLTTITSIFMMIIAFVVTYFVIRLFPKG